MEIRCVRIDSPDWAENVQYLAEWSGKMYFLLSGRLSGSWEGW